MEFKFDEFAAAVNDLLEITCGMPETYQSNLMKELLSCFIVRDYLDWRKKKKDRRKGQGGRFSQLTTNRKIPVIPPHCGGINDFHIPVNEAG